MRKILLYSLFIAFSISSYAQNPIITGNVIEEGNGMKMAEAIIAIDKTPFAETTDENGVFSFYDKIAPGEHWVSVTKEGYESTYIKIKVFQGKTVPMDDIKISLTKKESKRRKKEIKSMNKDNKKSDKKLDSKIKSAEKADKKKGKRLAKDQKKLDKLNKKIERRTGINPGVVAVINEALPEEATVETISPLQITYAEKLGVTPQEITNIRLYEFIDEWMGTRYHWGGNTKDGIDCSMFAIKLYHEVRNKLLERTAHKIFVSPSTDKWKKKNTAALQEFDLVFFNPEGDPQLEITHIGVYLANNKFVNATEFTGGDGVSGVRIDDLSNRYWKKRVAGFGRKKEE